MFPPANTPPETPAWPPSPPPTGEQVPAGPIGPHPPGTPQPEAPDPVSLRKALVTLPMTVDELGEWRERIRLSKEQVTLRESEWDTLWSAYLPTVRGGAEAEDLQYQGHFRNVHTKMGQLFVKSPEVRLTPKGKGLEVQPQPPVLGPDGMPQPQPPLRAADGIAVRQALLNQYLGADQIDILSLIDECCLDMQAYSGISAVLVSYRSVSRTVQQPVMGPDPNFIPPPAMPGSLGLNTPQPPQVPQADPLTGQPKMQPIQVPIHEEWTATRLHPKKVLLDERLKSCRHDKDSRWIGHTFFMTKRLAQRQYGLTDEEVSTANATDDRTYQDPLGKANTGATSDLLEGQELWLKAEAFTDNDNPDAIIQLVLFECVKDAPVVYRLSLDQTFDDQGALTEDSLEGFPLFIGSLRPTLDSPYPKSDSAFTNGDVKHLTTHRRQTVATRDAALGHFFYDTSVLDEQDLNNLKNAPVGSFVGLKPGSLQGGADKVMINTAQAHMTPDDWRTAAMLKADMDETLGISAPQSGGQMDTVRSATEINTMNQGAVGRSAKEQARVVAFFLQIVRAVDTLLCRYATGNRWVTVEGPTGAKKLQVWNKQIGAGKYAYDIKPDSQLGMDAARDRQQKTAGYNVMAADPLFNRGPALREICADFGWDPAECVLDPAIVNAHAMVQQQTGTQTGQPPHGGGPVNKHQQEQSGSTPNAPGAAASGDNRQERNQRPGGGA